MSSLAGKKTSATRAQQCSAFRELDILQYRMSCAVLLLTCQRCNKWLYSSTYWPTLLRASLHYIVFPSCGISKEVPAPQRNIASSHRTIATFDESDRIAISRYNVASCATEAHPLPAPDSSSTVKILVRFAPPVGFGFSFSYVCTNAGAVLELVDNPGRRDDIYIVSPSASLKVSA